MLQYVNSFSCTKNERTGTIIIQFQQNEPILVETETGCETVIEGHNIASVVLERDCAAAFIASLNELLENTSSNDEQ